MRLSVLAGSAELLRPAALDQELAAGLLGPEARLVTAQWLPRGDDAPGVPYHDFLREAGDGRIEAFARALRQDFGTRCVPLIVLPDLLHEAAEPGAGIGASIGVGAQERLSGLAVLERIWGHGGCDAVLLAAIALPAESGEIWDGAGTALAPWATSALDALRAACLARGIPAGVVEARVIELRPGHRASAGPRRNALAGRLAPHLERRLAADALALDPAAQLALVRLLEAWSRAGIEPAHDIRLEDLPRLVEHALSGLLAGAADG